MLEKTHQYGKPWIGMAFPIFLMSLFLYAVVSASGKNITAYLFIGIIVIAMSSWAVVGYAMMKTKIIVDDKSITYEEPLAKNLWGHKKRIKSKWQEILEVKEFIMYPGHNIIIKTVNGTFRITSAIRGYQDLMKEIRDNIPHLQQVLGSKLLHLVEERELKQVRKRKLALRTKIWIGFVSLMILSVYVFVAKSFYDFLMISLAWFYVGYLVQTKK